MKLPRRAIALCIAPSLFLSGCIHLDETRIRQAAIADTASPPPGTPQCTSKGDFAGVASVSAENPLIFAPTGQRSIADIEKRAEDARDNIPDVLSDNPVIQEAVSLSKLAAVEAAAANHKAVFDEIDAELRTRAAMPFAVDDVRQLSASDLVGVEAGLKNITDADAKEVKKLQSDVGRTLWRSNFVDLQATLREQLLRTTKPTTPKSGINDAKNAQFWQHFKEYYDTYYQGKFVDYFGNAYAKPSIALTITDVELGNTVNVFLEFLFDEAAHTPIWYTKPQAAESVSQSGQTLTIKVKSGSLPTKGDQVKLVFTIKAKKYPVNFSVTASDTDAEDVAKDLASTINSDKDANPAGIVATVQPDPTQVGITGADNLTSSVAISTDQAPTYYPGGTSNRPTSLSIQDVRPILIADGGCGMTPFKAIVMNTLAQGFASGTSSATATAVGTLGGIEVGPSVVFGKINIGDNKALTSVIQTMVTEIVARLTVEAAYPVLSQTQHTDTDEKSLLQGFYSQ